jgi:hypothetical protein
MGGYYDYVPIPWPNDLTLPILDTLQKNVG